MPSASPARASGWEWTQAALLLANLGWSTICLGGYQAETQVLTGALTSALLIVHLLERVLSRGTRDPAGADFTSIAVVRFHAAGWWMLPFVVYAAINVVWVSPVPWLGWRDWFWWAQGAAVFWVVLNGIRTAGPRRLVFVGLLGLGVLGVVLGCYQRFVDPEWLMLGRTRAPQFFSRASGPFVAPNSFAGFLLLLIPACGALAFRRDANPAQRVLFAWLVGVLAIGLLLTISRGALIALGLALTMWPLFSRRWSLRRRLIAAVAVLVVVSATGATIYRHAPKVRERFLVMVRDTGERSRPAMWRAAWLIFRENPLLGGGAGSFNTLFEKYRPEHQQDEPVWAHNDYLNTLSDYGLAGFALFAGGIAVIAWRASRPKRSSGRPSSPERSNEPGLRVRSAPPWIEDRRFHTGLGVGLAAFAVQLVVEFHLKIPALAMSAATIAALATQRNWPVNSSPARANSTGARFVRLGCGAVAVAVFAFTLAWNLPRLRAEAIREPLRRELDLLSRRAASAEEKRAVAERVRVELAKAVELDPANAQAWADRAYAIAIIAHLEPQREIEWGRLAEQDARRAVELSEATPEFWVRLGVALDMQHRWNDAGPAFSEALKRAPASATIWFYQAYHFALNPVTYPLARAAVATCLRLDPSIREADALRRHLTPGH